MQGASALQNILDKHPDPTLRVLVVWEPVIPTDVARPTSGTLGRLHDPRVAQYWDGERSLSREMVRAVRADPARYHFEREMPEDFVVWDVVALFPPGTVWESDPPVPTYYGGPVVEVMDALREALENRPAVARALGDPETERP